MNIGSGSPMFFWAAAGADYRSVFLRFFPQLKLRRILDFVAAIAGWTWSVWAFSLSLRRALRAEFKR